MQKIPLYPNDHRKLILLIDDDKRLLERIQSFFPNYHFRCFDDYDQTLLAIRTYYPAVSLVIMDHELFVKNRLHSFVPNLPILVWSKDNEVASLALKNGADGFIPKPVDLSKLGELIEKLVNLTES